MFSKLIFDKKFEFILRIILVAFGIFLIFQVIRVIMGGSWSSEDIILGFVIFNTTCLFTLGIMFAQLKSDMDHLKVDVNGLKRDNKRINKQLNEIRLELRLLAQKIK